MKNLTNSFKRAIAAATMLFVSAFAAFTLTSCDEVIDDYQVAYSMGFDTFSYSSSSLSLTELQEEMDLVSNTFMRYLGVDSENFTMIGSVEDCDALVESVCEVAAATLDIQSFAMTFSYTVTNDTTGELLYTYSR